VFASNVMIEPCPTIAVCEQTRGVVNDVGRRNVRILPETSVTICPRLVSVLLRPRGSFWEQSAHITNLLRR